MTAREALRGWPARRWGVAAAGTLVVVALLGIPTDVIGNPWFGRATPPTWWSLPVLLASSALTGLVLATYVATIPTRGRARAWQGVGPILAFFAIGCPVCNKLVLLALGTTGALNWFEPVQPLLAVVSIVALSFALQRRLVSDGQCKVVPSAARGRAGTA